MAFPFLLLDAHRSKGQAPGAVLDLKRDASDWPTT